MALFTDGSISRIADLTAQDSSLLDVANTEGINLTAKIGLAQEEIGAELTALFETHRSNYSALVNQTQLDLQHIAVTVPVRLWHTYQALAMVYRDAYYNQLNDRYRGKWDEYRSLAKWARTKLMETGIGIVSDPIPQAGAPVFTLSPGTGAGGTLFVSTTFLNTKGEEGAPSAPLSMVVPDGQRLSIGVRTAPPNVQSWNAYAGTDPGELFLQNDSPLNVGTPWIVTPGAAQTGRAPGAGQSPNFTRPLPRMLQRG